MASETLSTTEMAWSYRILVGPITPTVPVRVPSLNVDATTLKGRSVLNRRSYGPADEMSHFAVQQSFRNGILLTGNGNSAGLSILVHLACKLRNRVRAPGDPARFRGATPLRHFVRRRFLSVRAPAVSSARAIA